MPEEETSQSPTESDLSFVRDDDFTSLYANSVRFETSAWDLKMLFGELDQSNPSGKSRVVQHTAMAVSWLQAKIMAYYLYANVILHEADYGKIQLPPNLQPAPLGPLPEEFSGNEIAREARAHIERLRKELIE
jgi:hypothetical protein